MNIAELSCIDERSEVVENRDLGAGYGLLRARSPGIADRVRPGQFVMIETSSAMVPLLRRPMSIQAVSRHTLDFLYKVVGDGTERMAAMRPGDRPRLLGPLGSIWPLPEAGETALLLGGGVGIAPLVILADALDRRRVPWRAYLGVASAQHIGACVGFEGRSPVFTATMDGSAGVHGTVLDALSADPEEPLEGSCRLYACGPTPMLEAVQRTAAESGLPGYVSVETLMACGVGLCMGCSIENTALEPDASSYDRWLLACRHGPVFDLHGIRITDDLRFAAGRGFKT